MTLRHVVVSHDPDDPNEVQVSPDDLEHVASDAAALRRAANAMETAWPESEES